MSAITLIVTTLLCVNPSLGESTQGEVSGQRPTLRFFYHDRGKIEWVTDAEPDRRDRHLSDNRLSSQLYSSLSAAVENAAAVERVRTSLTRWLEKERNGFDGFNRDRFRKAEGIIAYLRAHDFSVSNLVAALRKRSGATEVELTAIHLVDEEGGSSFLLKVALPEHNIALTRQGFNVPLQGAKVDYTHVVYALGVALYELHEIIHADSQNEVTEEPLQIEELPIPDLPSATLSS